MNVFLVLYHHGYGGAYSVDAAFETREDAARYIERKRRGNKDEYRSIEKHEVLKLNCDTEESNG